MQGAIEAAPSEAGGTAAAGSAAARRERGGAPGGEGRRPPLGGAPRVPGRAWIEAEARRLADRLAQRLGAPVALAVTDNRCSLISARKERGTWKLRLHHLFLGCDEATEEALAHFALGRRPKTTARVLDAWIAAHAHRVRVDPAAGPRAPAPPKGRHHDLQAIFDRLNAEYFDGRIVARIGWGRWPGRRRRRSMKMGAYDHEARLIRVHPALDQAWVPEYYVAYVVYHEMLHQIVPVERRGRRIVHHTPRFRALERRYAHAEAAEAWEAENFDRLLASRASARHRSSVKRPSAR